MIKRVARMLNGHHKRDAGDVLLSVVVLIALVGIFSGFVMSVSWVITSMSKKNQRASIAQEAADVAIAQAVYALNEDYGVISDSDSWTDAYDRLLPSANSPETANLDQFNATKETSFHEVDGTGTYGIQAEVKWWVDVFPIAYTDDGTVSDQSRVRAANQVGDLVVEARVFAPSDDTVYATRSVKMPLYNMQVRAVEASTDGRGLSYVASPLSLFQYGVFGTQGISDLRADGHVRSWSPMASSGDIILDNPNSTFNLNDAAMRRYDASMFLFGQGECGNYNPAAGAVSDDCPDARTLRTGFEVQPDTMLLEQMQDYCGAQGLDDFVASEQVNSTLVADDSTYCFRDFDMDADVRLVPRTSSDRVVRIFVQRNVSITDGAKFLTASGSALGTAQNTEPQAVIYTLSTNVTLEAPPSSSTRSKFYMYAPNARCAPGAIADNPSTGTDESNARSRTPYLGSIVCREVVLDSTYQITNNTPFPDLVEFGSAGFGSDLYPSTIWYVNGESTEFVSRSN